MAPDVRGTFTAHARDLVYRDASDFLLPAHGEPGRLVFQRLPERRESLDELARTLRVPGHGPARVEGDHLVAPLTPGVAVPAFRDIYLDAGPYRPGSFSPERLVLQRRSTDGGAPGTVALVNTGSDQEEWRHFLARDVDVVPYVKPSFVHYLSDVPSVRLVPIPGGTAGILFRVDRPAVSDTRVRRAITLALRRKAIARVVTGTTSTASDVPENATEARRLVDELRADHALRPVELLVLESDADKRAAMVIEQQLSEVGLDVRIAVVSLDKGSQRTDAHDFDMQLLFAGYTPFYFRRAQSGASGNITGYSNPDFDHAVAAGETATAVAILERDVPMLPLYTATVYAAIDRRLCGAHPQVTYDYTWVAGVHLCAPGENE
jgi:ABC-type transport system substrate-binding protein